MTKVFLTKDAGGAKLEELKAKLIDFVKANEGITNEEIATQAKVDVTLVDALLAELSNEGKVRLYV